MTTDQGARTSVVLTLADGRTVTHTFAHDWSYRPDGRLQVLGTDDDVVAEYPADVVRRIRLAP